MEQREGRCDRFGRLLKEPLSILYCLVPRTYDERMFHQLVARDRWHGVLLGKAAAKLASDEGGQEVRLESAGTGECDFSWELGSQSYEWPAILILYCSCVSSELPA
jgi:hypothetical protein